MMRALIQRLRKVKWKIESRGSLTETKGLLSRTVHVLQPEQRIRERFPGASSSTWKGAAARSDNNFSLKKFFASPTRGTSSVSFSMQVTHCRHRKDGPNKDIQVEVLLLA
ncbi:unnamed protein product [Lasius platythorax]|uniref:Uncharacterized protein n=1 Tax=Lasius platythorax TaxID=488582 RepID=A0AAV2P2Z6_9HYME